MLGQTLSRALRKAFVWWGLIAGACGPLLGAYKFASSHTGLLPGAAPETGTFAIIVNVCMLVGLLMFFGAMFGCFVLGVLLKEKGESEFAIVGTLAILVFMDWFLLLSEKGTLHVVGYVALILALSVPVVRWVAPIQRWFNAYAIQVSLLYVAPLAFLLILSSDESYSLSAFWRSAFDADSFKVIPLSSIPAFGWIMALVGGATYGWLFVRFQRWRAQE